MDIVEFFKQFQDYLAPKLDTYEQAIYLYIFRHSRFVDQQEATIGFKSARRRMALGIGKAGTPMAESRCYEKLRSLEVKGLLEILGTERTGTRIHLKLPHEIPGLVPALSDPMCVAPEQMDFFGVPAHRLLILQRERHRCFYCLCAIHADNYVIEHVVSRPAGDNGYRNVVAACMRCNNRKGAFVADDFLRTLYREGFLSPTDFQDRLSHLERLQDGKLVPETGLA